MKFMFPDGRSPEPAIAIAVILLSAGLAMTVSWRRLAWLGWWERPLARVARHKGLAVVVAALLPMALRAALLPWYPIPEPRIQDEFSFLLAADTLLHGRLANPAHPFWQHFETMHVLARPVYASAFPIGQAVVLAAGTFFTGRPWFGVWLSGGLMCGAICWMLQGWMPSRWAILGAFLATFQIAVASYWMNSYWGGFVAATGGALLLGTLPRAMREPRMAHAFILGAGYAMLAYSRSFEGAMFALAVSVPLLWSIWRRGGIDLKLAFRRFAVPLVLVLMVLGTSLGYYFWRLTGKPWDAPYVVYRNAQTVVPHFVLFQKPSPPPLYNNREMWDFYVNWEMIAYRASQNFPKDLWVKTQAYWRFYLGVLLTIPLLGLIFAWRKLSLLLGIAAFFSLALVFQVWHNLHYAAPATGLAILLVMLGMRRLRLWRLGKYRIGLPLVRCLPVACALMLAIRVAAGPEPAGYARGWRWPSTACGSRAPILKRLQGAGGKHLVFVRYSTVFHDTGVEWVYNGADIDGQPVVWARELDAASNSRLMKYYGDRQVWLVEPDEKPECSAGSEGAPVLMPYRDAQPRLMPFVAVGAPGIPALEPSLVRRRMLEANEGIVH